MYLYLGIEYGEGKLVAYLYREYKTYRYSNISIGVFLKITNIWIYTNLYTNYLFFYTHDIYFSATVYILVKKGER